MNVFDRSVTPGTYFARFYIVDPREDGPDEEIVEELCNEGETISLPEAIARAKTLEDSHSDAHTYEVVERQGIHWDYGWEWRAVTRWEVGGRRRRPVTSRWVGHHPCLGCDGSSRSAPGYRSTHLSRTRTCGKEGAARQLLYVTP